MIFVSVSGFDEAHERLRALVSRGADLTPLLTEIGENEVSNTLLRFEQARAPDGSSWQALKRPRAHRRGGDGGNLPLNDTGALKTSIKTRLLGDSSVLIGSDLEYAITHQYGRGAIPARPYLGLNAETEAEILEVIYAYFAD